MRQVETLKKIIDMLENSIVMSGDDVDEIRGEPIGYHAEKTFQLITGMTTTTYLRYRRLYLAALEVVSGVRVEEIYAKYGYASMESFSRAFKQFHGCNINEMKSDPEKIRSFLPFHIMITVSGGESLEYRIEKKDTMTFAGIPRFVPYESSAQVIMDFFDETYAAMQQEDERGRTIREFRVGEYILIIELPGNEQYLQFVLAGLLEEGSVTFDFPMFSVPGGEWAVFGYKESDYKMKSMLRTRIFREWFTEHPEYELAGNTLIEKHYDYGERARSKYGEMWVPVKKIRQITE